MASVSYVGRDGNVFEFCLTNKADIFYGFDIEHISINDYTLGDYNNYELTYLGALPGCQTEFQISLEGDDNEEILSTYGIEKIDRIDFSLDILVNDSEFDDHSYSTEMMGCEV